jgi:Na+-transporting NADH:ubiquinone oxidoreductase subunit NqrB
MQSNYSLELLKSNIVDQNTIFKKTFHKDHNVYTHLGCVLLRCVIGAIIILHTKNENTKQILMVFCMIIIIMFASKFINNSNNNIVVWKAYLRPVIAYSAALGLIYNDRYDLSGTIIIVEALMGLQSRHDSFISSYISEHPIVVGSTELTKKNPYYVPIV